MMRSILPFVGRGAAAAGVAYRYWRIFIQTVNGASSVSLTEVELRAVIGGADLMTTATPVTASNEGTLPVANIRDNNLTTHWNTGLVSTNQWVRFDLGTAQQVAQVAMYPRPTLEDRAPKDFIIQGSNDGTNFTDVKAFTEVTGWTAAWRTFDL